MANTIQDVAGAVVRRAQRQGSVTPRDLRGELKLAGLPESDWKELVRVAQADLHYRQGRYYPVSGHRVHLEKEQEQHRAIDKAIRKLIRLHKAAIKSHERRDQARIDFIQPVKVQTEDGTTFNLLSRDLSTTGIRILGAKRLLGHKVHVFLPQGDDQPACKLLVRILWTCAVGDDLFENGGVFLEIEEQDGQQNASQPTP